MSSINLIGGYSYSFYFLHFCLFFHLSFHDWSYIGFNYYLWNFQSASIISICCCCICRRCYCYTYRLRYLLHFIILLSILLFERRANEWPSFRFLHELLHLSDSYWILLKPDKNSIYRWGLSLANKLKNIKWKVFADDLCWPKSDLLKLWAYPIEIRDLLAQQYLFGLKAKMKYLIFRNRDSF